MKLIKNLGVIFNKDITISSIMLLNFFKFFKRHNLWFVTAGLSLLSIYYFFYYLNNGLGLAYNDARSHLDIGRRVVEGLKPGIAQLGSVWLPLGHALMIPLIWNDWAWHSGFAGAIWNMISFVGTGIFIYKFLEKLKVGLWARIFAVAVFSINLNILYLQSTAMTEPLLLFTMLGGSYYLMLWAKEDNMLHLIKSSIWIMLATLIRYDGWFLMIIAAATVGNLYWKKKGYRAAEGIVFLFLTMAGFGIFLWIMWNWAIFKDPLYFIFGPFSAHSQQEILYEAGDLHTKGNFLLSAQIYFYSLFYNSVTIMALLGLGAFLYLVLNSKENLNLRISILSLISPLLFNIISLIAGFSVIFVQGISGNTWFNIRYGIMLLPAFAISLGYFVDKVKKLRSVVVWIFIFTVIVSFNRTDSVVLDDARVGSSQKNVSEVAGYLEKNSGGEKGFILISAASHDAIIFSSNLPMKRFIHEGTGKYWDEALKNPESWARWIVLRTYDQNDLTYKALQDNESFKTKYDLVDSYPFADVYALKNIYVDQLNTEASLGKQK